jgi:hypothetical protein
VKWLIPLLFLQLSACASLKPIESAPQAIPQELPPEIQSKFQVAEVPVPVVVKKPVRGNKKPSKKSGPVPVVAPVVKKFNPIMGQRLVFAVYAPLGVRAGTLITKVEGVKTINNQEVILLKANVYNAAFFASIFTVNLLIESYVDPVEFKSVRYQVVGQEGKQQKHNLELYDYENKNIIEYKEVTTKEGVKSTSQKSSPVLTEAAQDILSAFWKVVSLDFSKTNSYTFAVATSDKLKVAQVVKLSDYENGWVLGLAIEPGQNPEDRKIFLNTKTHVVDRIEANIKWGKFKVIRVDEP